MISSQQALNETIRILKEHLSDVSGETGDSHAYGFYQLAQNIFVKFRVADHGLYMQTFVSHDNGVAPELVSIISVVYRESPKEPIGTKWKTNGYPNSIIAFQYVYPCWDMDFDDIPPIAFELITFAKTSTFVPPHLCTKDVKVQEITSDIGIRDVTNKLRARYCSIKESKTKKNMKEEIDMGQVPSAQDVRDERSKRQVVDNLPEVRELKRKVNRMRLELDKCEEGSQAEKELISKIKAANQQIRDYYDRPLNLRSLLGMNESKTNKNMKKNVVKINENTLRQIVAESVKKVLKEGQMGFSRDADSYGEGLRSRELNGVKPQRDEMREHSRKILMGIYDDLHTWETYAMDNSNGIDKQAAFDAYMAAMEAIETLGKAFYGDEFWGN